MLQNIFDFLVSLCRIFKHMVAYGSITKFNWKEAFSRNCVKLLEKGNLGPNFLHLEMNQEV